MRFISKREEQVIAQLNEIVQDYHTQVVMMVEANKFLVQVLLEMKTLLQEIRNGSHKLLANGKAI